MAIPEFKKIAAMLGILPFLFTAQAHAVDRNLVGSWNVQLVFDGNPTPVFNNVTFLSDGTVINSDPFFGGGHGVWTHVSGREYAGRFLHLVPPEAANAAVAAGGLPCAFEADPGPALFLTVDSDVQFDQETGQIQGTFTTRFSEQSGAELCSFGGEVLLTRFDFESE